MLKKFFFPSVSEMGKESVWKQSVWSACGQVLALKQTCLDASVREVGSQHFSNETIFIFHPSRESLAWGNWVAVAGDDNTMSIWRSCLLPSFQLLNRCWSREKKTFFPDPAALLCYTFLYTGPAQKGELSLKVLQMTLPCFHISLNLRVAKEVKLKTAIVQEISVLDL